MHGPIEKQLMLNGSSRVEINKWNESNVTVEQPPICVVKLPQKLKFEKKYWTFINSS